jgi:hypothetical protein
MFMFKKVMLISFVLMLIQSCSGITVSQDYERGFDFSKYKSFAWLPEDAKEYGIADNELVDRRIRSAMEKHLISREYEMIDTSKGAGTGEPDFYISYQMSVEQRVSSSNVSGGISVGRSSYGRAGSIGISSAPQTRVYDQGKLQIDITDAISNKLSWRGLSTQQMSQHSDPEKMTAIINETVDAVMQQFPPKP